MLLFFSLKLDPMAMGVGNLSHVFFSTHVHVEEVCREEGMSFTVVGDFPHKSSKTKQEEIKTFLSKSDYT